MNASISSAIICPICKKPLVREDGGLVCENSHRFDRAKSGYVNLLRSNSSSHGDDRAMVRARTAFLEKGCYSPMRDELCKYVAQALPDDGILLDAGCGEGWYDAGICAALDGRDFSLIGIDISKEAVDHAAKRAKLINRSDIYAVASVYELPVADKSVDCIISVFSPFAKEEFDRVLKPNGTIISVIPLEDHLMPLKAAIYDKPYKNEVADFALDGYELASSIPLRYGFHLESGEDIKALFSMTPYFYRTDRAGHERLDALTELDCEAQFDILVYKRK